MQTVLIWAGIGFFFLLLTNLAFFDVLRRDFGSRAKKTLWAVIALVPFIGCLIYLLFGMRHGRRLRTE